MRDEIKHSWDVQDKRVTKSATEVLEQGVGICRAKANLLAALLRACGIPTGICYQCLTLGDVPETGFCIHALNAVYIKSLNKWIRLDARGNKEGVDAQFDLGQEKLAFPVRGDLGEEDYRIVYANPSDKLMQVLEENTDALYMYLNCLPDSIFEYKKVTIEVSMLVYGDSKWFENNNYEEVCTFIRTATGMMKEEGERNDGVLSFFYVIPTEQEIYIKGNWRIEWEQYVLDISRLQGGIAIASGDIQSIKKISVDSKNIMTVENKTPFQRLKDRNSAMLYLGGFANRHQIAFLKKVISDNPHIRYIHFGDVDIGGFLIHKHLCRETSKKFELYCMGLEQLCDMRFSHCLRKLTDNDMIRLESLMEDASYRKVLEYMKEHNIKLEQEIVSYYLEKDILL